MVPGKIYRGARPDDAGLEALKNAGVKTVIDLQGGDLQSPHLGKVVPYFEPGEVPTKIEQERAAAEKLRIRFVSLPLNSLGPVTPEEGAEIDRILEIMHDPAAQPVYIHCEHGKDRTGLLVALYRVKYEHWRLEQAHREMAAHGHQGTLDEAFTYHMDLCFYRKAAQFELERLPCALPPPLSELVNWMSGLW